MLIKIAQINPDTQQLPESPLPWEESTDWLWIWPAAGAAQEGRVCSGPGRDLKRTTCTIGCLCKIRAAKQRLAVRPSCLRSIELHGPETTTPRPHPEVPITLNFTCAWGLHPLYSKEAYWDGALFSQPLPDHESLKGLFCKNTARKKRFISLSSISALLMIIFRSFRNDCFVFVDMLK